MPALLDKLQPLLQMLSSVKFLLKTLSTRATLLFSFIGPFQPITLNVVVSDDTHIRSLKRIKFVGFFFFFHLLLCRIQIKELDLHFNRKMNLIQS